MIRLNKYLSEAGICSRREADRLIEAGRVTVDGVQAVPGMKVSKEQKICVGKKVIQGAEHSSPPRSTASSVVWARPSAPS